MKQILSTCFVLVLLTNFSIQAQKRLIDPRPLKGLINKDIPVNTDLLKILPSGYLMSKATSFGNFSLTKIEVNNPQSSINSLESHTNIINQKVISENGTINWLQGKLGNITNYTSKRNNKLNQQSSTQSYIDASYSFFVKNKIEFKIDNPLEELIVVKNNEDELGFKHIKFKQMFKGFPIYGSEIIVHINKYDEIYTVNGNYEPTHSIIPQQSNISSEEAKIICENKFKTENRFHILPITEDDILKLNDENIEIAWLPTELCNMKLCYVVEIHPNLLDHYTLFIDAVNGQIIKEINSTCKINPNGNIPIVKVSENKNLEKISKNELLSQAGFFNSNSTDLSGGTKQIRVYQHTDSKFYMLWDLDNLNNSLSKLPNNPAGGAITLSAQNSDLDQSTQLSIVGSNSNSWSDPASVSAHANMEKTFIYWKSVHNRKAIDDQDQSIVSVVHVTDNGRKMDNAFWNGRMMAYGDGDQAFTPLAEALDVSGHEMTHGVVQNTANLVYEGQAGALNESFADVFGIMIDRKNFLMGEDIMKSNGNIALRDISNPSNPQVFDPQPDHMNKFKVLSSSVDNGGVHINSGIPNKAAYNAIVSLNREKVEKIWYRALSVYLTRSSQFIDSRKACEKAAQDLFGANSNEFQAVGKAFADVGIGGSATNPPDNKVPPVNGGQSFIAFMTSEGKIGYFDLAKNQAFLINNSNAVARVSTEGDKCQLSVPTDGKSIWFVNADGILSYIDFTKGEVFGYNTLNINKSGDIWNASISPNGNVCALVSSYLKDPTIYLFDGTNLSKKEIKIEGTQSGIEDQTIQYPDVISWSPNVNKPKIGFDGYNEISLFGEKFSWWGMYELNIQTNKFYNLVPAQSEEISIGNVNYTKTNSQKIAFNVINIASGVYDTYIVDFDVANSEFQLNIPSFTIGGRSITDADRPTFSPDDKVLCLSSPMNESLLFYTFATKKLTFFNINQTVYNPVWFMLGGKVSVDEDSKLSDIKIQNNRNIISISLSGNRHNKYQIEVFNSLGNTIYNNSYQNQFEIIIDLNKESSGVYYVKVSNDYKHFIQKISLLR